MLFNFSWKKILYSKDFNFQLIWNIKDYKIKLKNIKMNIYALSSGWGPSEIAILGLSGKDILKICKEITKEKEYVNILEFKNSIFITPTNLLC